MISTHSTPLTAVSALVCTNILYIYTRLVETYYVQKTKSQGTTIFGTAHRVVILNNKKNWGRGVFFFNLCVWYVFDQKQFLKKTQYNPQWAWKYRRKKPLTVIWWDNGQNQQFFFCHVPAKIIVFFSSQFYLAHSVVCGRQFSMYTVLTRNDRFF